MKKLICLGLALGLLAGFYACGQGEAAMTEVTTTEATTTTITTTQATTAETACEPFTQTVTQRIHKDMPEFTFTLRGDAWQIDGWPDMEYAEVRTVEINSPNGEFHQIFDEFDAKEDIPFYKHQVYLSLADYNNDGYLDLRLQLVTDRNTSYSLFWLWDAKQQRFVKNEQLKELSWGCNLHLGDDGTLIGSNTAGGGIGWGHSIYHYENGGFIETEARSWLVESNGVYLSIYQLVDGEMKLISTELWEE